MSSDADKRGLRIVGAFLICAALVAATRWIYLPMLHSDFINYDDPDYVTDNEHVSGGLTWSGVVWAFSAAHAANWHPLTWLSHMLDAQLFGLHAARHHLVNLVFHAVNSVLLFLLLKGITRAQLRSAMVAALFALHPMHVESVAWVSERKDVLSALFFLLTIWAYARYAGKKFEIRNSKFETNPKLEARKEAVIGSSVSHVQGSRFGHGSFYFLALTLFALGLMAKPMLVTLPFILLLLDFWPLNRTGWNKSLAIGSNFSGLLAEKIPFLILSVASSIITFMVQKKAGAVASIEHSPLASRLANAAVAYLRYIGKLLWPHKFALPYVDRVSDPALVAGAVVLLIAFSLLAYRLAGRRPYLLVGWLWFIGMLIPVIGVVQVGSQTMADRYTYLPSIGLFIVLVWPVSDWFYIAGSDSLYRAAVKGVILTFAAIVILSSCAFLARGQVAYWRTSETLFGHTLEVTTRNYVAHDQLGEALATQGKSAEARVEFLAALEITPGYAPALSHLSQLLLGEGDFQSASVLLRRLLDHHPEDSLTQSDLAMALAHLGKPNEALPHYREAIRLEPTRPEPMNNLAWLLATCPTPEIRDGAQAVSLAERACEVTRHTNLWFLSTLAAAYAEAGRFTNAATTQEKVCQMASQRSADAQAHSASVTSLQQPVSSPQLESFRRRLELYRAGSPYHAP